VSELGQSGAGSQTSSFVEAAGGSRVLDAHFADVGKHRSRQRRVRLLLSVLGLEVAGVVAWWATSVNWLALLENPEFAILLFVVVMIGMAAGQFAASGRSPHVMYRPEQIDVTLDDVVGLDPVKEDVVRSLNLFLAHATFAREMGGTPRRGLLFEGPPGTGKTYMAKAMAREAGVPFLFASATSFRSMFTGASERKIRRYFHELRKAARREGGAIGFIDEFDAIGGTRAGMAMTSLSSGSSAAGEGAGTMRSAFGSMESPMLVNELLVQMQSFDTPSLPERLQSSAIGVLNTFLPHRAQIQHPQPVRANVLIVASTNRAEGLDPALMRPGRFDRRISFDLPDKAGRRDLVDHFLRSKSHAEELDDDDHRDALAAITVGYSPVMLEHLLDEGLVNAVRRGSSTMSWSDIERARLVNEVGLGHAVSYTEHEKGLIATHEAGHAVVTWIVAPHRRLEVLTIIKRGGALGLLAHGDRDDVYTRSRAELDQLLQIAFGGQVAEEIFFDDISTGPAGDLAYATSLACQMVGANGMAGSLVSFAAVQNGPMDGTNIVGRVLADSEARPRVERLLDGAKSNAHAILSTNRHLVLALRDALLERHELIGSEITDILERASTMLIPEVMPAWEPELAAVIDLRDPSYDMWSDHSTSR
jgi:ATP-dependent Zn protease